jgi:hypothetical protein
MAKKAPPLKVRVTFETDQGDIVCDDVIFKSIPLESGAKKFWHLEQKGNRWLMLHTDGMLFDSIPTNNEITIVRDEDEKVYRPHFLLDDGRPLLITRYTVLTPVNTAPFYHLDELDDNTYRITHSTNLFETKWVTTKNKADLHRQLNKIKLEVI